MRHEEEDCDPELIQKAASAIASADILLVCAGAGFSADSGLPVYADVARLRAYQKRGLKYQDLCYPGLIKGGDEERQLFYGFWGTCLNNYRDTEPHEGYRILRRWKQSRFGNNPASKELRSMGQSEGGPGACYVFSSNVDGHFVRAGFAATEVNEIHGSVERWQCGNDCKKEPRIWKAPPRVRIYVDSETQLAPEERPDQERAGEDSGRRTVKEAFLSNHPECLHENWHPGRPNVYMFGDYTYVQDEEQSGRYKRWLERVQTLMEAQPSLRLVVLELGAGHSVPTVRGHTEKQLKTFGSQCTVIRVNPEYDARKPEPEWDPERVIALRTTSLVALEQLDAILNAKA